MKKTFLDKKIPTILGLLIIAIGLGVTTFLVNQGGLLKSNAGPSQQPQEVRITNITGNSFSVSYITDDQIIGSINFGKDNNLGQAGLDDRDQQTGTLTPHKIHNITVRNLTPGTKYYFDITSASQVYMNSGHYFEVTTGTDLANAPPQQNPIAGKIVLPSGDSPKEAIIYVTTNGAQVVSTLVKSDGSYILPLNSLRSSDLSSYYNLSANADMQILVIGDGLNSNILLNPAQTHPVPVITLSKNYDFRSSETPVASASADLENFPSFTSTPSAQAQQEGPKILTPTKNQGLSDQQPLFKGTGEPGETVSITIHSDQQIQTQVTTDNSGNWSYRPSTPLSPGEHTIYIVTKDAAGVLKTISQTFVVYAQGSQIKQPATTSTTPTPTPTKTPSVTPKITPTSTPTLIPTVQPTVTPSITPSVTPTLTPSPTAISTLSSNLTPTPNPTQLLPTGNPSLVLIGIFGAVITALGGVIFFLNRKNFLSL